MRTIRTITWNLSRTGDIGPKIELLREAIREAGDDTGVIVCLQEVTSLYYRELLSCGLFSEVVCSLSVKQPERTDGGTRMLGCAFGCNDKINLGAGSNPGRLATMGPGQDPGESHSVMHMVNVHSLSSIGFDKMKSVRSASVSGYLYDLARHNESVIFCGKIHDVPQDEFDPDLRETSQTSGGPFDFPGTFFGVNPRRRLQEALKMWLKSNPVCMASRLQTTSDDPLTVTLIKGGDHHYDFLFISPQWVVKHIDQRHDASFKAGSHHAMIVCDLAREAA